jgi:orotidine-5'-phosphate decarboxylase
MTKLCLALDTDNLQQAWDWCVATNDYVDMYKIGPELFSAHGKHGLNTIASFKKPIFLDLKLHDIPNTVYNTVKHISNSQTYKPFMISVHASGDPEMIFDANRGTRHQLKYLGPMIIGVTVLTSDNSWKWWLIAKTWWLARKALNNGASGIVCSPPTVKFMKKYLNVFSKKYSHPLIIVPGIRYTDLDMDDQKQIGSPRQVAIDGADYIVVGRPITTSKDPKAESRFIKNVISN